MNNNLQLVLKSSTTEMSLNDHDAGIYIVPELDGLTGLPEIRTTSGVNAGYDGGWTSAQKFDARSIVIRGVIANEDKSAVERMRRELVALLAQGKNEQLELDFVTETGRAYEVQVRTIACDMAMQRVLTQQEFMITLRADDPLIYDASETGHEALLQVAQATGGFTIDFELPLAITGGSDETVVNNEGLEQVPTITRMYGALHNPKIINQTNNEQMQIMADLGFAEGDWIDPSEPVVGKDITINDAPEGAPLASFQLDGNTSQQTYSGKNLLPLGGSTSEKGLTIARDTTAGSITFGGTTTGAWPWLNNSDVSLPAGTYTLSIDKPLPYNIALRLYETSSSYPKTVTISAGQTSGTATTTYPIVYLAMLYGVTSTGTNVPTTTIYPMLESGSTATSFEPYVGGTASPNPDYPQAVKTITGENVVKMCGKNLYPFSDAAWSSSVTTASWCFQDGATGAYGTNVTDKTAYKLTLPAGTYRVSMFNQDSNVVQAQAVKDGSPNEVVITNPANITESTPATITLSETTTFCVRYRVTNPSLGIGNTKLQLELGSTATDYEPYQGQSYPISLGSLELCKIGNYQDYIYKSGDKWYVHKAVGKWTVNPNDGWYASGTHTVKCTYANSSIVDPIKTDTGSQSALCAYMPASLASALYQGIVSVGFAISSDGVYISNNDWTVDQFKSWATNSQPAFYYPLATTSEEEITNVTLIGQLEAILSAGQTYAGTTNITTVIAEGNEQGTLEISYFTDKNPDVRDELVIDSRLRTITLNGLDVYHLQAPGSEFIMLEPGENKLMLESDITGDNGYAEVSYKQGYLSI